jgi:hypothetical protein
VYRLWLSNAIYSILPITYDNELFKGKNEFFPVTRFLLELTQHIRPVDLNISGDMGSMLPEPRTSGRICLGAPSPCDAARPR